MTNTKVSASKKVGIGSREKRQKQGSPRSPLKLRNLNACSSSCSSSFSSSTTATSISSEAPKGCLRFFLSHHSSSTTKYGCNARNKSNAVTRTPKSAPNVKNMRGNLVKKRDTLRNPENPTSRRIKRNPPAAPPCWKSGGKVSSRYDLSDGVNKFSSGFQLKSSDDASDFTSVRKPSSRYDFSDGVNKLSSGFELKLSENTADVTSVRKPSSRYELDLSDNAENFTPVNKLGCGSDLGGCFSRHDEAVKWGENDANCSYTSRSPTPPPPVQSSVSPEIQGGSTSMVAAMPTTCYAAGHLLSGVTDRRKCRPRGILTIGDNDLFGSSKTKALNNENESVVGVVNNRMDSIIPPPTEASVRWLSSPCDEKRSEGQHDDDDTKGLRLNKCEKLMPFKSIGCSSSPSSSLGFSSELFNESNSTTTTSDATTTTTHSSRRRSSSVHSDLSTEFRGLLGPSFDHLVCSPSPSSPVSTPTCKVEFSPKEGKHRYSHERETTPYVEDSIGSGNVIQTPQSNSTSSSFGLSHLSPQSNSSSPEFGLSHLSRDEISRLWFECELDSVTEVLRRASLSPEWQDPMADSPRVSFEFNPLIKPNSSIDFTLFRKAMDSHTPLAEIPGQLLHSLPEPEVRISWREGLASRIFEMDELDCCRCLSDEEDYANGCSDTFESCTCPEIAAIGSNINAADSCDPATSLQNKDSTNEKHEEISPLKRPEPCVESMCDDGGCAHVPEDSSWTVCYRNNLFQV